MTSILLDCDPGVDDALAILLALRSKNVTLKGITTVSGNASARQTTLNACRVLDYFEAEIPVAKGASRPLRVRPVHAKSAHGNDGLGDSTLLPKSSDRKIESKNAIEFIADSVESGVRTIVATGPLTNIALTFQKEKKTLEKLDQLIIMGGSFRTPGNVDSLSEFNFYADPDAADYVLGKTEVEKVLVPLDVTHKVLLTPKDLVETRDTPSKRFVRSMIGPFQKACLREGFPGSVLHDPLAMGFCIDNTFLKLHPLCVRVESRGVFTRGTCVTDERPWVRKKPNVKVALEVDSDRFIDYFKRIISED